MGALRSCPRCSSLAVERLPSDGISPLPGYACRGCGATLRANGTGVMYGAVLAICLGLLAFFSMPLWNDEVPIEQLNVYILVAAAGVAAYAVRQLLRPVARLIDEPGAGGAGSRRDGAASEQG